jgi:PleD family two-component response regulator
MGVATFREPDQNFDDLLSRADQALYAAKSSGRNKVCKAAI